MLPGRPREPANGSDPVFAINCAVYHAAGVARRYARKTLSPAEALALLRHREAFAGHDVLDIGVGTGRTTPYLAPLARRYEAVDYSPVMVRHMRTAFPAVSTRQADIRDLSVFAGAEFDFAFAPDNVIDAVSHDSRLRALQELHRVLRPGGVLAFSAHNRRYRNARAGPRFERARNPLTLLANLLRWIREWRNHLRVRRWRRFEAEYALIDDSGHEHACLHYYIDAASQRAQLERCGFHLVDLMDDRGALESVDAPTQDSPSLMYVAQREAGSAEGKA